MSYDEFRSLTEKQVKAVNKRLAKLVQTCSTCMPSDGGEAFWITSHWGLSESVQEALELERISREHEDIRGITDQLEFSCPGCGAMLDSSCEVGEGVYPEEMEFISEARTFEAVSVNALVMFGDVSGFSTWSKAPRKPETIAKFLMHFYALVKDSFGYLKPALVKMLGDGIMFVWELETSQQVEAAKHIVWRACTFPYDDLNGNLLGPIPAGIRFGFAAGRIVRLSQKDSTGKETFKDYVGYHVNLACRIQSKATVGTTHIHGAVKKMLEDELDCEPVKSEKLKGIRNKDWADIWKATVKPKSPAQIDY
jgi:class 3 adenylate cyclase